MEKKGISIFTFILVGALLGIIGFGVYFLYNPITESSTNFLLVIPS